MKRLISLSEPPKAVEGVASVWRVWHVWGMAHGVWAWGAPPAMRPSATACAFLRSVGSEDVRERALVVLAVHSKDRNDAA